VLRGLAVHRLWRCGSCDMRHAGTLRGMSKFIIDLLVKTRNRSISDTNTLLTDRKCVILAFDMRGLDVGSCAGRDSPSSNSVAGIHHALIVPANTYVSANEDGWQFLYNLFTCRSTGPVITQSLVTCTIPLKC
jgi:hypothetical protein